VTIGTLDGANIEIQEAVGDENIFVFGKTAEEVEEALARDYDPWQVCRDDPMLGETIEMIRGGFFSAGDRATFEPLLHALFHQRDRYMVLADFAAYWACQQRVAQTYLDQTAWTRKSIVNVARAGRFSSDRTVLGYAREIWGLDVV
jgi:starch phosphorylase